MLLILLLLIRRGVQLFCNPMGCSPPGSSVHGIFQARILEQVAISFPRGSSQPRRGIEPTSPALAGGFFTTEPPGKLQWSLFYSPYSHLIMSLFRFEESAFPMQFCWDYQGKHHAFSGHNVPNKTNQILCSENSSNFPDSYLSLNLAH